MSKGVQHCIGFNCKFAILIALCICKSMYMLDKWSSCLIWQCWMANMCE